MNAPTVPLPSVPDETEKVGQCLTCEDPHATTRLYRPVWRDDWNRVTVIRLCLDCASIIRHGAHEEFENVIPLGNLTGRTITWFRAADQTHQSGVVLDGRDEVVEVWTPLSGAFRRFRIKVTRQHIVCVWPLPPIDNNGVLR